MQTLTEIAKQKSADGRKKFMESAWRGLNPEALLEIAKSEDVPVDEADRIVAEVSRLKSMRVQVDDLPRLAEAKAKADKEFEAVRKKNQSIIDQCENLIGEAALRADEATAAFNAVEAMKRELLSAEARGLAPRSKVYEEHEAKERSECEKRTLTEAYNCASRNLNMANQNVETWSERLAEMQRCGYTDMDWGDGIYTRAQVAARFENAQEMQKRFKAEIRSTAKAAGIILQGPVE